MAANREEVPCIIPRVVHQNYYERLGSQTNITWDLFELNTDLQLLEVKIGFALYGEPRLRPRPGIDNAMIRAMQQMPVNLRDPSVTEYSDHHTGYDSRQVEQIVNLRDAIVAQNKFALFTDELYMSTVFTICVTEQNGDIPATFPVAGRSDLKVITIVPVFRIRKCVGENGGVGEDGHGRCMTFVDHEGRVYPSWQRYLSDNRLPSSVMITPKDGIYNAIIRGGREEVLLTERQTAACSAWNRLLSGADMAGIAGSVAATCVGVAVAIPAVAVAPAVAAGGAIAGVTAGAYSVVRSSMNIHDRLIHEQNIGLGDREARGDWLSIAGGAMGTISGGATSLFRTLVGRGVDVTVHGRNALNVINGASLLMNGAGTVYGAYQIYDMTMNEGRAPTFLMIFQVSTSIFFFTHSLANMRTADAIMHEAQQNTMNDYRAGLRSNRHRRAFNRMARETIRVAGADEAGRRDIIRSIRNIQNQDDFFAGAVRMNRQMNQNNVRISFSPDGRALLNNQHPIDPMAFWSETDASARTVLYQTLPPPPAGAAITRNMVDTTAAVVRSTMSDALFNQRIAVDILSLLLNNNSPAGVSNANAVIRRISFYLSSFSELAVQSFTEFFMQFIATVEDVMANTIIEVFPEALDHIGRLFNFLYSYLSRVVYDRVRALMMNNDFGGNVNDNTSRTGWFSMTMEDLLLSLYRDGRLNEEILNDSLAAMYDWLQSLVGAREAQERDRGRVRCTVCDGIYYGS